MTSSEVEFNYVVNLYNACDVKFNNVIKFITLLNNGMRPTW